jgi:hypothetical protein
MIQLEAKNHLVQLGRIDKEINVEVINDIDFKYVHLHVDEIFKTTQ